MKKLVIGFTVVGFMITGGWLLLGATEAKARPQSIVALLALPEKYDGRIVSVSGFFHNEFESSALYLSSEDADFNVVENSIWIGSAAKDADTNRLHQVNDEYVRVEGVFKYRPNGAGHGGAWSSELHEITLFVKLPRVRSTTVHTR